MDWEPSEDTVDSDRTDVVLNLTGILVVEPSEVIVDSDLAYVVWEFPEESLDLYWPDVVTKLLESVMRDPSEEPEDTDELEVVVEVSGTVLLSEVVVYSVVVVPEIKEVAVCQDLKGMQFFFIFEVFSFKGLLF